MSDGAAPEPVRATDVPVDIPPFLRMLWHGEENTRPGPKRGVDLLTIATVGVRIADAEGLSAVSMRRLATEIGFTTMALYRYVASKSELVALLMDHAYGDPLPRLAASSDWRSALAAWATANREVIAAHPWILEIRITEPPLTPSQIGWMEVGLSALADTGLGEQEKLSSILLIDVYVRGQAQLAVGMSGGIESQQDAMQYASRLRALTDPDRFPRIRAALLSGALEDYESDFAVDEFAFGLDSVLDGIEARIRRRRDHPSPRGKPAGGVSDAPASA